MSKYIRIHPSQDARITYQGGYNTTAWNTVHDATSGTTIVPPGSTSGSISVSAGNPAFIGFQYSANRYFIEFDTSVLPSKFMFRFKVF